MLNNGMGTWILRYATGTPSFHGNPQRRRIEELKKKGYRVVCATNTEKAHYDYHLASGQYEIFDTVYASLHLKEVKPDAAFFEKRENMLKIITKPEVE